MDLKKQNILFLDLQTTGAKPGSANILEIAWSTLHSENIESYLVEQPEGDSVPRRIQFITGICDEDMNQAKSLFEILTYLKTYIEDSFTVGNNPIAVIHFAQFEKPFLLDAYDKIHNKMPFTILCTHEIAKRLFPNLPTRGIKGLAGYFGFPKQELKRAANHVQATQIIWQGLTSVLAEKGIHKLEDLEKWLQDTPKTGRVKYEYPLPKEKRLSLPKQPGIYRMISKWGEVLYVGKATSLHDRVNSYFRGQKNRDSRKLEMLTQVWDLHVTPVGSPLEAALLETDEIKRLDPPYNISLKTGQRTMVFFNRNFTSVNTEYDEDHCVGPFSTALALDSMIRLSNSIQLDVFDENMFFELLDPSLLKEGFELFCQRHSLKPDSFASMRSILAVGLNWARKIKEEDFTEPDELREVEDASNSNSNVGIVANGNVSYNANANANNSIDDNGNYIANAEESSIESDSSIDELANVELTPDDIADKFERHFIRSAKAYLRTKKLTRLLNADIYFKLKAKTKKPVVLKTRQGQIVSTENNLSSFGLWKDLSIDTYDRMTVLFSELQKLLTQNNIVKVEKVSRTRITTALPE